MKKNSLRQDFALRKGFFANRASAVFPVYFLSQDNDLILSWLNYWTIKNGIDKSDLAINLRVYDEAGVLHVRSKVNLRHTNNSISIRSFIKQESFKGMAELEVISLDNIRFTFPAIIGFYKTGSLYSCVHSAGRIKGPDENHSTSTTEETNWSCKFDSGISPFFHYVNGNSDENVKLKVNLKSADGETIASNVVTENMPAFGSKLYLVDGMFEHVDVKDGMFIGVECSNNEVFRRMVVGNLHKSLGHLEVTHSFPKQQTEDYCPANNGGAESFLPLYNDSKLSLTARVFPTNCLGNFSVKESNQGYGSESLFEEEDSPLLSSGFGCVELESHNRLKVLWLKGKSVPSRLNCNFIYTVKDSMSNFSTDIATGAKSTVYPPKHSHWGSGVFGNGYDFALIMANLNHNQDDLPTKGILSVYGLGYDYKCNVELDANSSNSLLLSDLLDEQQKRDLINNESIFTWFLNFDQPHSETFWVSFREADGCIVGEHGF